MCENIRNGGLYRGPRVLLLGSLWKKTVLLNLLIRNTLYGSWKGYCLGLRGPSFELSRNRVSVPLPIRIVRSEKMRKTEWNPSY